MLNAQLPVINKLGLHARAAAKFVNVASRFGSSVRVKYGEKEVDGKSIMSVMMLAAAKGATLELVISGDDELEALTALTELVGSRFDEAE